MKATVFSAKAFEKSYLLDACNSKHDISFCHQALSVDTVNKASGSDAISIFSNDDASSAVLDKLKEAGVKFIAIRAAGYDQVNLHYAADLGIKVANVPKYSPYAIAEHAVAMMLALNRKIVRADKKVKDYNFSLDDLIGFDMNGKTAGIIGVGKIGRIVAKILNGFGCKILAYDINKDEEAIAKYNVEYCGLERLASLSDIITIHAPLNLKTRYLINKDLLWKMKKGVMLINTGRGGIIKTIDVIEALKAGHIGSLGLDVYEHEKGLFFYNHSGDIPSDDIFTRLLSFKNVLITGHQAFLTETALQNIADTTIHNLDCWQNNLSSENEL
jgi:D-lactate dehydrogenase